MPRSTRHKSSKHKDARDYSDSEKESRKSGDKRKHEYSDSVNGDYYEEYTSSSKRRKGSGNERWNGKDEDKDKGESSKKTKASSRRDADDTKKTTAKHRDSSRRDTKDLDKERKHKDKFYDADDHHKSKPLTESKAQDHVRSPGTEKRSRRKRDDHVTGDKHQDYSDDVADDYIKEGKQKGDKSRDKYKEDDIKHKVEKQRDDRPTKDHPRSDEKLDSKRKSKLQDNDQGHEPDTELDGYHDRERNRDYDRETDCNERTRDRDRERDRDRRDYDHDRYHERDRSRDRDRDHDRDRTHDREKDRSRDYYHDGKRSKSDRERDSDRLDDQSGRCKDRRESRRSPDYQDYQEVIVGTRSSRAEPDGETIRSERHLSTSLLQEENGNASDQILKGVSSREVAELSGGSERGSRHKVSEKPGKVEDGVLGEFPVERSSATKASPRPMVERSPSSTSLDRRYNNRSGARRSLEVEETGYRNNARDISAAEDERNLVDDTSQSQADLSFNNKANQNNSSFPPRPESRSGISSPRVGPREEDNRVNTGGRYKRGVDAMIARGQGNLWRNMPPGWASPLPNAFIPFQHVPSHGGFQTMIQQFPSPSLFGVRPSMEMSHPGMPYHMPDAERFSGHMRPLGWPNIMDSPGASHVPGYFGDISTSSVYRDESNMYGASEWDHNRRMPVRGWESGADEWKTRNGDASMEVSSMSVKDDNSAQVADDESLGGQTSHSENNRAKSVEAGSNLTSPAKELHTISPKTAVEAAAEDPVRETTDNSERYRRHYLSKLDISVELADPELRKCIALLMDEERLTMDDGTAVFVNLKEGGKRVPKSNSTSLKTLSLFPSRNSSVFQIAMDLYKEQRFEIKGLPNIDHQGTPQVSPSNLVKIDDNNDVNDAMEGNGSVDTSDVKIVEVSNPDTSQQEQQKVLSPVYAGMEIETQVGGGSSPCPENLPEALEAVASDHFEGYEEDAKPDDGAGVDQTMATTPEHDGVPVTLAMEVDEQKDLSGDENMEEAEEKEEVGDDDGEGGVVVEDVSQKVNEPLVHESDESVISRIHHSPQSTH